MKRSRFSETQVVAILKEAEAGKAITKRYIRKKSACKMSTTNNSNSMDFAHTQKKRKHPMDTSVYSSVHENSFQWE